ncbi:DUF1153 domain-containing protein [Thalassobaculum sp. OXR-137]|uniref:CtrA inhibitor SciP n=1 Tax=Thalassobaculum sp. OXR-137 TaxID=3100173 RepID=UPI002AC9B57C|nr:DUF1153 domain-containing protein [Thalassobaculum sp. OXR-137]WPZ34186.1 DUF1153 domain-containing protein [Thalassobaculum sp. OXR-137]
MTAHSTFQYSPANSDIASEDRATEVVGPDGNLLSLEDLPPQDTQRWVMRRKAEVVAAVRGRMLTVTEACERWNLSEEEFASWQRLIDRHGVRGLRATRIQQYRRKTG